MEIDAQDVINEQSRRIGQLTTQNIILEIELTKAQQKLAEQGATDAG